MWDTAGQERFRKIAKAWYRDADGVLLVYDVTDEYSFFNIRQWMKDISENASDSISRVIVGNKCDMISDRCVSAEKGKALAKDYGVAFYETSAKNDINVQEVFVDFAKEIIAQKYSDEDELEKHKKKGEGNITLHHPGDGGRHCSCQLL